MTRVLVTGATGFIAQGLIPRLISESCEVRAAVRQPRDLPVETIAVGDIGPDTDWSSALHDVQIVVHLAGRAHITAGETDPLVKFRLVNAAGTAQFANQAEKAGVGRFIYVSSVKAAADQSGKRLCLETDKATPRTPYGISKLEGEQLLCAAAHQMETVILRPPLVYGPGVQANFLALLKLIDSGLPIPLGAVRNQRSLIARDNLVDAIIKCLRAPAVAGGTFYVADGAPLSTPDLIRQLGYALGKATSLWSFPPRWLAFAAGFAGRADAADSLLGSLAIDDSAFRTKSGWRPPLTQTEAFHDVAVWYKAAKKMF